MTPKRFRDARGDLGRMWGLGRPLRMAEMGRVLRLGGHDPGQSIRDYERGTTRISGPVSACIDMMLQGAPPPDGVDVIRKESQLAAGEDD